LINKTNWFSVISYKHCIF